MRVNVYAEELTDRVEIIEKVIDGQPFTGLRFYLELPISVRAADGSHVKHVQGPFMHGPGDDDSAAVTFWGKQDLRVVLRKALALLDKHYSENKGRHRLQPKPTHQDGSVCPECGTMLVQTGSCKSCPGCGFNEGCA